MLVEVVTCYESNEERVSFVCDACKTRGYDVRVITSDFSHIRKEKRNNVNDAYYALDTKPYDKNLSLKRIRSHRKFAKDAFSLIKKHKPDLIWLMAPANSLIKEANDYKRNNNVKLIIDIIDMWPESLPFGFNKHLFPFSIWRNIRKNNINCADALVTECDMYKEILQEEYKKKINTIYWARNDRKVDKSLDLPEDKLSLCYIGSINNIIDIDTIYAIIFSADKPVAFHIVGEGEKAEEMVEKLENICYVTYYGAVRDEEKKNEIFKKCHAGINIYKEGLYIGLTVKCIDYFEYGLPIINNIKGDTWSFVTTDSVGINVNRDTEIHSEDLIEMRMNNQNIYDLFKENFTKEVFVKKCLNVIDEVMK